VRVLQVDAGREWRGGQTQVRLLARELARQPDVEQRLVTKRDGELAHRSTADGIHVIGVAWTISLDPRALVGLLRTVRSFRPEIIHAHDSHALRLALVARKLAARQRSRVVAYRLVDYPIRRGGIWFRADHIVAVSGAVRGVLLAAGVPAERVSVIPPGVDPEGTQSAAERPFDVRRRLGLQTGTRVAVNVGALVEQKDQLTLVRAAYLAREREPDLHWVIAGEGKQRAALEAEISRFGLGDRVHLLGHIDGAGPLLADADVFVLSSKAEGLPNVVLEALALGRPVVATRAGGTPEVLPPGALVNVGDADALAQKVAQALHSPVLVPLPPQFTIKELGRAFMALYRALV